MIDELVEKRFMRESKSVGCSEKGQRRSHCDASNGSQGEDVDHGRVSGIRKGEIGSDQRVDALNDVCDVIWLDIDIRHPSRFSGIHLTLSSIPRPIDERCQST